MLRIVCLLDPDLDRLYSSGMGHSLKHRMEYGFFRCFAGLVSLLPYRAALTLGWIVAATLRCFASKRVHEARRRIRQVMGEDTPAEEVSRIAWISLRNFCFNMIEVLRIRGDGGHWLQTHLEPAPKARLAEICKPGEGAIAACVHTGNWELGTFMMLGLGYQMTFFFRPQKNELINQFFLKRREQAGLSSIPSDTRDLRGVVKQLREGRQIGLLPDLRSRTESRTITFLGHPANISHGAAVFARMADVPVVPYFFTRRGWGQHHCKLMEPVYPDKKADRDEDSSRMMQELMSQFEKEILQHPEQYFWFNKRWVLEPLSLPDV
jgi:KDO2-lipid IV(A) lauroyltransferase